MAKDKPETVEVPAADLARLLTRLDALELAVRVGAEKADQLHPKAVYDAAWEAKAAEASRPAAERTQLASDRLYGTAAPRWRVRLDSADPATGRPGPAVSEWPAVTISANSPEEAEARWMKLCGVRSHQYQLRAEAAAA